MNNRKFVFLILHYITIDDTVKCVKSIVAITKTYRKKRLFIDKYLIKSIKLLIRELKKNQFLNEIVFYTKLLLSNILLFVLCYNYLNYLKVYNTLF